MKNNIFINKYVMACAISIVIALVGYISMSTLPVEQYPDIAPPTVNVSTSYTGADENTVMKSVIQPLEVMWKSTSISSRVPTPTWRR